MKQNLYPYPPYELSDIRPIKFVDITNPPYPCPLGRISVDKIAILICGVGVLRLRLLPRSPSLFFHFIIIF
jgi:hypothetical protein